MSTVHAPSPGAPTFDVSATVAWPPGSAVADPMPTVPDIASAVLTSRPTPIAATAAAATRPSPLLLIPFIATNLPFLASALPCKSALAAQTRDQPRVQLQDQRRVYARQVSVSVHVPALLVHKRADQPRLQLQDERRVYAVHLPVVVHVTTGLRRRV